MQVLVLVLVIFMAWILYSSMVSSPNPQISGTSRSGITGGLGNGLGTGFGTGGGLGSEPGSGYTFPNLNFGLGSISWPSSPLTFHFPSFSLNLSFLNFFLWFPSLHFVPHNSGGKGGQANATNNTSPTGGNGGSAGNAFNIFISLETVYFLLAGVFVAVILIMVTQMVKVRKSTGRKQQENDDPDTQVMDILPRKRRGSEHGNMNYAFTETMVPFYGWQKNRKILDFGIPGDIPLNWSTDVDLTVSTMPGNSVFVNDMPLDLRGASSANVRLKNLCTPFRSEGGGGTDLKVVRAISPSEDIIKLFRLNLINERDYAFNMTPTELARAIHGSNSRSDLGSLINISKAFSAVFYGKKEISMTAYQDFMRNLGKAIPDARVFTCEGN